MSVFVFGSNLAGRHGKGSALQAVKHHGAIYGVGYGRQGASFGIPTKGFKLEILPLPLIQHFVQAFKVYAWQHQAESFDVVAIGCGLAAYKPHQIAPFFDYSPPNVSLPYEFLY